MGILESVKQHMTVIGADGVQIGTVDRVDDGRIKLTREDDGVEGEGVHEGHHHYIPGGLVAEIEGNEVRLSASAANAVLFEEEEDGTPRT